MLQVLIRIALTDIGRETDILLPIYNPEVARKDPSIYQKPLSDTLIRFSHFLRGNNKEKKIPQKCPPQYIHVYFVFLVGEL